MKKASSQKAPFNSDPHRPLYDLLSKLPRCEVTTSGEIDFEACDPELLQTLGISASDVMNTVHQGMSAIGNLLAHAASDVEDRSISGDAIEALGYLLAELGDLAAKTDFIATSCRRYTFDYLPITLPGQGENL